MLLIQLQILCYGWSTDIFLQANQGADNAKFYKLIGFELCKTKSMKSMSVQWQRKIKDLFGNNIYLKFIDSDTNIKEAKSCLIVNNEPFTTSNMLHLMECCGVVKNVWCHRYIKESQCSQSYTTLDNANCSIMHFLQKQDSDVMFRFPYSNMNIRLNFACIGLIIMGLQKLYSLHNTSFIRPVKNENLQCYAWE